MHTYLFLMSSPVGRILRILGGVAVVAAGILLDGQGSLAWLLLLPGLLMILAALMDLHFLAPIFGLPLIGEALRRRLCTTRPVESGLCDLTYVGERLRHSSGVGSPD
jgi:hypothetical protein